MFDFSHARQLDRIENNIAAIMRKLNLVINLEFQEMASTADIKAQTESLINEVTAETNAVAAVTTLVNGLKSQISDLQTQLATAIANGADPAELQAISDNLKTAIDGVDANSAAEAALTNTPASPTA